MRALFVTNQRKTEFYDAVAQRMAARGGEIFWVSLSGRQTRYLLGRGWPAACILDLERCGPQWGPAFTPTPDDWERLARLETVGLSSFKNIIVMDRELNKRLGFAVEPYVHVVTREIEAFTARHDIKFGFGEDTWAPEMITHAVLQARGGQYYIPHSVRVPSVRFGFFRSCFHDRLAAIRAPEAADRTIALDAIRDVRERGEKPFYFLRNMNPQRLRRHWFEEALLAFTHPIEGRHDHTVPPLGTRIVRRLAARWHASAAKSSRLLQPPPTAPTRPYVLVPLQKQPESSIDVYGQALSDQLEVLRALARILPFDWEIWAKEHPHAIGDRSCHYYRQLSRLPGVRLIDASADNMALIRGAGLVASVSGTACMEAGLMKVPALTFAPMFFGPLLLRNGFNPFATTHCEMAELLAEAKRFHALPDREEAIETFMTDLVSCSFDGVFSDPISAPECMTSENVGKVADACAIVMRYDHDQVAARATRDTRADTPQRADASNTVVALQNVTRYRLATATGINDEATRTVRQMPAPRDLRDNRI